MSSDYYFRKWKDTLRRLKNALDIDLDLQESKAHDHQRCHAANRLTGVLGEYIDVYNYILDSSLQNLQVQKIKYMGDILHAVVGRILELKNQLGKLESINYQFLSQGLIEHKLTTYDAEFKDIPVKFERPEHVNNILRDIMKKAQEERERLAKQSIEEDVSEEEDGGLWWDMGSANKAQNNKVGELEKKLSDETIKKRAFIALIVAQEKSRQVIRQITQQKVKRDTWEKELYGVLQPKARVELRVGAAKMIQRYIRAYFVLKRKKIVDCRRDEILGLRLCKRPEDITTERTEEIELHRKKMKKKYQSDWINDYEEMKQKFYKRRGDEIAEDYRERIREWFRTWFDEVKFFYEIPQNSQGGSILVLKEEVPTPGEWLEQYKEYIAQKKSNKGKSTLELKYEKMEAKKEEMRLKKEQHEKDKLEAKMLKKAMKNPSMHPGYTYPKSKKTAEIVKVLENYHKDWHDLDEEEKLNVKVKYIKHIDESNAWMEIKLEIMNAVDDDMREELKKLKKALKEDYVRNEEEMPETMKKKLKRERKKPKVKPTMSESIAEKLMNLAARGFVKEYPKTSFEDFIGDPNFAGDEIRCNYKPALPYNGETRSVWWERCRELVHGFHRILLVGPNGSGKTKLVHAMASTNDAVLFELDPLLFQDEILSTAASLQLLVNSIASCAKAAQPSVIYIRHVHQLFFRKVPPKEEPISRDLLRTYLIKKLFKKIQKFDKITIIGSCIDPWLTTNILKSFPTVLLMPNTSCSTTVQILKEWVLNNYRTIPAQFDVYSLAYLLQGYEFGFLKDSLNRFMSPEMIVRTAAYGLRPEEVYDFILQDGNVTKPDYEKYQKWYFSQTQWGKLEKNDIQQQKEFKEIIDKWAEKTNKKKKNESAPASTRSSLSKLN